MGELNYLHWLGAAAILLILEMFSPGAFMLWIGLAAIATTIISFLLPALSWQLQLILFAGFCVASLFAWKHYAPLKSQSTDQPTLNQRSEQYVGRVFMLSDSIENGVGKIIVDDTQWKVYGPDLPVNTNVRVVGTQGTVLLVEPE
jgi:membrane protein implicated in regulation of membrane protease activity